MCKNRNADKPEERPEKGTLKLSGFRKHSLFSSIFFLLGSLFLSDYLFHLLSLFLFSWRKTFFGIIWPPLAAE